MSAPTAGRGNAGPPVRSARRDPTTAFALIELLAVTVIALILAGLMLPALFRAGPAAAGLRCRGNLRQWGIATSLFTAENNDYLPKDGALGGQSTREGWYVDLPRVMGIPTYAEQPWRTNPAATPVNSIWICAANRRRSNGHNLFHYCLNGGVNGGGAGRQILLGQIPKPSLTVWLFDNGRLAAVGNQNWVHTNLHSQGAQFLFLDGHVARHRNQDYWNFLMNLGRTDNPSLLWRPD